MPPHFFVSTAVAPATSRALPHRLAISFSQGAEWKALISQYIAAIPPSGDACCEATQRISGGPAAGRAVSSAMMAKVGAAASPSQLAARTAMPRLTGLAVAFPESGLSGVRHFDPFRVGRGVGDVAVVPVPPFVRPALRIALR